MPKRDLYAGIDLGSNSFHLVVARREHGELRQIDQLKDMVRLAGGVDRKGHLSTQVEREAIACLARFAERIQGLPEAHIRAVGTQTFRRLRHADRFHTLAETTLGAPIEVISGREEARLVYRGVWQGMANQDTPKLILDVGGGSTEVVAGQGERPVIAESLPFGCVGMTLKYFDGGKITAKRWHRGREKIMADAQALKAQLTNYPWEQAIGSSGTARALVTIAEQLRPLQPAGLSVQALTEIKDRLIEAGHVDGAVLPGLSDRRRPVIVGGALIVDALLSVFDIQHLTASKFALREGVLYDLLERLDPSLQQHNPRLSTLQAMMDRYQCDHAQAQRVRHWALMGFDQVAANWSLGPVARELLETACQLHEVGLSIAHDQYHLHSGYILAHADMPGFSSTEQQVLACLASLQRAKPEPDLINALPQRLRLTTTRLLMLMRLAVALARPRSDDRPDQIGWYADGRQLILRLPNHWLETHPLTQRDLHVEADQIKRLDQNLSIESILT